MRRYVYRFFVCDYGDDVWNPTLIALDANTRQEALEIGRILAEEDWAGVADWRENTERPLVMYYRHRDPIRRPRDTVACS